ncbi:calcium/sodium antiporter [Teredinibacter purpureus]|uniref:calcium/sodium antiporter n=1 Tax=Teredinibacter purpureus TaxID=2731756 RepID=UPI0005F81660|nr:calcium/sodium antiporter [Teredinibacter purpureus]
MLESIPFIAQVTIAILIGFVGLIWSADRFVGGAASIARSLGVAPLIIGLTIVSFGTSAPEIMVSISASLKGAGDLAVGNALGSNIANIGLVLAATTIVATIPVQRHILHHELPILLLITGLSGYFLFDATLTWVEGVILLGMIAPALLYLVRVKQREFTATEIAEEEEMADMPRNHAIMWFVIGLVMLMVSSEVLVWGARSAAELAGVSPLIIGLTVIAIGTSLPELAATMISALKGHHDIALGNIIGSNMFNLMAVMAIPGIVSTTTMENSVFSRDYLVMLGLTLLLALLIVKTLWFNRKTKDAAIGRWVGVTLLCGYIGYYVVLFQTTTS